MGSTLLAIRSRIGFVVGDGTPRPHHAVPHHAALRSRHDASVRQRRQGSGGTLFR